MQTTIDNPSPLSALPAVPFSVTDAAYARIARIREGEPDGAYFRVEVQGGGCSGYQYHYTLDNSAITSADLTLEKNGVKVVIDDVSMDLLKNSVLDYAEDLGSAGFEIKNPNAKSGCGCGNSFSL